MTTKTFPTVRATSTVEARGIVNARIDGVPYQFYADVDDFLEGHIDVLVNKRTVRITF